MGVECILCAQAAGLKAHAATPVGPRAGDFSASVSLSVKLGHLRAGLCVTQGVCLLYSRDVFSPEVISTVQRGAPKAESQLLASWRRYWLRDPRLASRTSPRTGQGGASRGGGAWRGGASGPRVQPRALGAAQSAAGRWRCGVS